MGGERLAHWQSKMQKDCPVTFKERGACLLANYLDVMPQGVLNAAPPPQAINTNEMTAEVKILVFLK
jgi:hypothetical protein